MGHLAHVKEEYHELVARLNAGPVGLPEPEGATARAGWQEILELLYTPEEAAIAARLPLMPARIETIASRVGLPAAQLKPRLEAMADKGIVMDLVHPETGEVRYLLSPPVVGFFEFSMMRHDDLIPKKRMAQALDAYTHGDDTFAREVFGGETVVGRAMVHETALGEEVLPDVLDWERATAAIEDAQCIAVQLCYCRHKAEHLGKQCDAPVENCMSLNAGAEFTIRRKLGRAADRSEALEILAAAREQRSGTDCRQREEPADVSVQLLRLLLRAVVGDQRVRSVRGESERLSGGAAAGALQGLLALLARLPDHGHLHAATSGRGQAQERVVPAGRRAALHRLRGVRATPAVTERWSWSGGRSSPVCHSTPSSAASAWHWSAAACRTCCSTSVPAAAAAS